MVLLFIIHNTSFSFLLGGRCFSGKKKGGLLICHVSTASCTASSYISASVCMFAPGCIPPGFLSTWMGLISSVLKMWMWKTPKSSCRSENEAFNYFTFKLKCRFCQWIPVKTKKPGQFCWSWFSYEEQTHPIKWPPAENKSLLSFVPSCFLLFMVPFSFLCYFSSVSVKY